MDLLDRLASPDPDIKLKALREVKNQIIGNRTKKLAFLKLGAIPTVASILAEADSQLADGDVSIVDKNSDYYNNNIIIQSAAALGSFACGFDAGVRAVLDAGALPYLIRLLSNSDEKVIMLFSGKFPFLTLYFRGSRTLLFLFELKVRA